MSPILGIYASSMQPALNATSFESIATVTVGAGGSSSISFSSIPSTYKHLQVRYLSRDNRAAGNNDGLRIQLNSDTATNYATHELYGDGASAGASANATVSYMRAGTNAVDNTAASIFGAGVLDILDYQNTNKYKTIRSLSGVDSNGAGTITLTSGLWQNTNAVSTVLIYPQNGTLINQYSSFALYGIKG